MGPVKVSPSLAPGRKTVSDSARARELYKYFQPTATNLNLGDTGATQPKPLDEPASYNHIDVSSSVTASKISSPDTALTAFAQLVSWRLGCQRSMISVIDSKTQYFIAESTRTLSLVDNTRHAPGDDLWVGCSEVDKAGRLCERTIEMPPNADGSFRAYIVSDLSKDTKFNQLPFVTGPPYLRFYAGSPLITKRGIPIGSLFVVDDRPRKGLSKDEIHFLGTMAATVMRHMEMTKEVEEHRRGMKMSRGLASFVEGRSQLIEDDTDNDDEGASVVGDFRTEETLLRPRSSSSKRPSQTISRPRSIASSIDLHDRHHSVQLSRKEDILQASGVPVASPLQYEVQSEAGQQTSQQGSYDTFSNSVTNTPPVARRPTATPDSPEVSEASNLQHLFSRAANLIREAFEIDGGCVFFDAQKGFSSEFGEEMSFQEATGQTSSSGEDLMSEEGDSSLSPRSRSPRLGAFSRSSIDPTRQVEVLGFSTPSAASIHGDNAPGPKSFSPFEEKALHALLRRYPRGKLWMFDEDGPVTSSSEDDGQNYDVKSRLPRDVAHRQRKLARRRAEARALARHFPGVRQLLFVPLWDSSRSRWLAGTFAWTNETTRILSKQAEFAFLTGFGNSVMAECSRLDTELADQKKSDFIGSISHELRSPLHGILASAEFLGEEVTEGFSKGLVETIDSCGRTLLDTINHILDYSKINHLEKNWRRSNRRGSNSQRHGHPPLGSSGGGSVALRQADLPMINLFADVDISAVCEEVVESVFAGHVFQNVTAPSFDMVADARGKMSDKRSSIARTSGQGGSPHSQTEVTVLLDVNCADYRFTTQPGAFRRVVMNLLGNALKYTSHGYVKVKLETQELDDYQPPGSTETVPRSSLTLTVSDTGRGISSEFIRSKLFTPFAQENSLSSGTGLGLSIVRSIVALLEGDIQIKSEIGRGTEVKITLPLLRELPKDLPATSNPKSLSSTLPKEPEEAITQLRTRAIGKSAALYGFDAPTRDPLLTKATDILKQTVSKFMTDWYGLQIVPASARADIIIVNEADFDTVNRLSAPLPGRRQGPVVLALASHSTRFDRANAKHTLSRNVGFLIKPIGPLKLARALLSCLDGVPLVPTPGPTSGSSNAGGSSPSNSDLSTVFEELSLSSRGGEVLDNSRMAAGSLNARKALESPTPLMAVEKSKEFPFPADALSPPAESSGLAENKYSPATGPQSPTSPTARRFHVAPPRSETDGFSKSSQTAIPAVNVETEAPAPRLLLVDDNKINLRLLRTYMHKRKYESIDEAENGLEAVQSFEGSKDGYDIIFMDISMPVLDGFGATRQIRQIEDRRREKAEKAGVAPDLPALIIALTGLASNKDQSEAFTSGVDLFLTKPVSFKEVGKMLDNWQANREREQQDDAAVGATTNEVARRIDSV